MDYIHHITEKMYKELNDQLEDAIIEGLKLKGFEFEAEEHLHNFIKQRCRCEDRVHLQEKTYYFDETPFLLHNYKIDISHIFEEDNQTKITATGGYYRFV